MSDIAIRAEHVSKTYQINGDDSYTMFRDVLRRAASAPFRRLQAARRKTEDPTKTLRALDDISFEVQRGDVVGIIGHNGAGKSTLLKILSRITAPSGGQIAIYGRVGSLLEVGTGFHPELTGRENVYLNGAILGMKRYEIQRRFDEIVAFAEVERFIDTPVKRYSTGMYMRLAFAVAAHLETEILIVDEVLAVGDANFQRKSIGKMSEVGASGRTVLFVSHNMAAVENLCRRGIVLRKGRVVFEGSQSAAIENYLAGVGTQSVQLRDRIDRIGNGAARIVEIAIKDTQGRPLEAVTSGQDVDVYLYFEKQPGFESQLVRCSLAVLTAMDVPVFLQHNRLSGDRLGWLPDRGAFVCRLPRLPLPPSTYWLNFSLIIEGERLDSMQHAAPLTVIEGDFFGTGEVPEIGHGVALVEGHWRLEPDVVAVR